MKRKRIRKILIIAFSVCLVAANVTSFTYAVDPVTFTEAETLGATIVDLYGAYNNTSLAYDQLSQSGALTEVVTLYNNYASNASDPYTLAAIGAAAAAAGAIAVIYDAVTGQGYVQLYQEQYISSLDGYWDYQLTDAGLVRDSVTDLFNWNVDQNDNVIPLTFYSGVPFTDQPIGYISGNAQNRYENGVPVYRGAGNNGIRYSAFCYDNGQSFYCFFYSTESQFILTYASTTYNTNGAVAYYSPDYQSYGYAQNHDKYIKTANNVNGHTWYTATSAVNTNVIPTVAFYSTLQEGLSELDSYVNGSYIPDTITAVPSVYIGDPLQNPLEITVPDPSNPDYNPQPARINTNIEWDPDWGTPVENPVPGVAYPITDPEILNDAVPGIWESIVSDGVEVGDPDPEPEDPGADANEVTIPFLPITLPSFNFNLSGIWHYVVTWVSSLGAWFTTLFTIWSCLPYAMVVPVYATAVIVIVLGVYRRFLT